MSLLRRRARSAGQHATPQPADRVGTSDDVTASITHSLPDPSAGPVDYDREPVWRPAPPYDNPTSMQLQPAPRKRRHVFRWVFLAVQVLFIVWLLTGVASGSSAPASCAGLAGQNLQDCIAAGHAGTTIGVFLIVFLWAAVDGILGVGYLIFRRRG